MIKTAWLTNFISRVHTTFSRFSRCCAIKIISVLILFYPLISAAANTSTPPPELSKTEIMQLGERMYRDGILPSGAPMPAFIRGDVEVDSSAFSCSSCHLRAGLGSFEGGVITPPTTGNKLYKPYRRPPSLGIIADKDGRDVYSKTVLERPPYSRTSLAKALQFGIDPTGQAFNDVMPRYPLSDGDMSILINYLELLSKDPSPGASKTEFRFATIITDDVSQEDRQALLVPLQTFIARKNQQLGMYNDFIKFGYTPTAEMKYAFSRASLDIWELKGPPATWQKQLAEYSAKNPVFAVLGGISNQDWQPIHDFCESERLPCLFPITDFPAISETGWYTYYFNKGFAQEGEAVARYLNRMDNFSTDTAILQIVQDSPAGKALATGFDKSWKTLERPAVTSVTLTSSQLSDRGALDKILTKHRPAILLLWADSDLLPVLPSIITGISYNGIVFMSSSYLGKKTVGIAETVRDKLYITFPYRLTPYVGPKTGGLDSKTPILTSFRNFGDRRIAPRTVTMLQQAALQGLSKLFDNIYRDNLLDIMSMQMDLVVKDYERLSFGPGQRYASKGCYIIQLGPGPEPELLPKSEWVIH